MTMTFTGTLTQTLQALATQTITATPTQAAEPEEQSITDILAYPNPYNPEKGLPLYVGFSVEKKDIDAVMLRIYTGAFRLVREFRLEGLNARSAASAGYVECGSIQMRGMSNGTYYAVITAEKNGVKTKSKVSTLIILK